MTDWIIQRGWPLLLAVSFKSLFVMALAGVAALLLHRASAAARHLAWRLGVVGLLLLPALSVLLPDWAVPLPVRPPAPSVLVSMPPPPIAAPAVSPVSSRPMVPAADSVPEAAPAAGASAPPRPAPPWQVWAFGVWMVGVGIVLLPTLLGLVAVRSLERRCLPITDGPPLDALTALTPRPIRLMTAPAGGPAVPMTWGGRRPALLLPPDAGEWPADRLRATLLHELAHIERADWPAQMAAQVACALYWFNPLVWLAARRMAQEAERACDDRVLSAGVVPAAYAGHLLDTVRGLQDKPHPAALPMAQVSGLEGRLRAILQSKRRQTMLTRKMVMAAVSMTLVIVAPLAAIRPAVKGGAAHSFPPPTGQVPIQAKNTVAQMRHLYSDMIVYRHRHGTFPTEPADGMGLLLGDMAFHPRDYGLPDGGFDRNMRRATHALANPDVRLMGYRGNPDNAGVYSTEHPLVNGHTLSGSRNILAWTSLYVHPGPVPTGFYVVLWEDGQIEMVPVGQVRFAPLSGMFAPIPATALAAAVRTHSVNWTPCFPGQTGTPPEAMNAENYWRTQIDHQPLKN